MSEAQLPAASESDLGAAQRWLFQRVTRARHAPRPEPADESRWVRAGGLASGARIAVYQRAYFSRLVECLRDDYPALERAVGAEAFEARCLQFIEAHPPASASLNFFGAGFADVCATWRSPHAEFWSELARLEWAVVECIHADAERQLVPGELGALTEREWSRARLVPSPASRLLDTRFPVHAHYAALLAGENLEPPAREASTLVVCRRGEIVWRLPVEPRWVGLLRRLLAGEPVVSALAAVPDHEGHGAAEATTEGADMGASTCALQRTVSEWVARGMFAGVNVD